MSKNEPNSQDNISVTKEMQNLLAGEEESLAQVRLSEFFLPRLIQMLSKRYKGSGVVDAPAAANSALRLVFQRIQEGAYNELSRREDLAAWLLTCAVWKANNQPREAKAKRRCPEEAKNNADLEQVLSRELPPDLAVLAEAQCRHLLALLRPQLRQIAVWTADDLSNGTIARALGCAEETIRRRILEIRSIWKRELGDERHPDGGPA